MKNSPSGNNGRKVQSNLDQDTKNELATYICCGPLFITMMSVIFGSLDWALAGPRLIETKPMLGFALTASWLLGMPAVAFIAIYITFLIDMVIVKVILGDHTASNAFNIMFKDIKYRNRVSRHLRLLKIRIEAE